MPFTSTKYPILVIIGPSGAGKSTLIRRLFDDDLIFINPTWTTRPPRPGETKEGIEHRFVSELSFKNKLEEGFFLETVQLFGLPYNYGLPALAGSQPPRVSLVMLRAPLLALLNKYYPNNIVYQIEDELDNVKRRLVDRQAHGEAIGSRLKDYQSEVEAGRKLAKRVFVKQDFRT
jgi:guanylate kinase